MNATDITTMKPADLVEEFIRLRDERKQVEEGFEEEIKKRYGDRMEAIKVTLLDLLNKLGVDSIAGRTGTAFKSMTTSVTVADAREFRRHVIGGEHWDLIDWRANKTAVNELVDSGEPVPPGINRSSFWNINVRRKAS
jgi:hypothetical protein